MRSLWPCLAASLLGLLLGCEHPPERGASESDAGPRADSPSGEVASEELDTDDDETAADAASDSRAEDAAADGHADNTADAFDAGPLAPLLNPSMFTSYPAVLAPTGNPLTREKALLGKALFWDEQLSVDDTVACGTCHRPAAGGADPRPSAPDFRGHPGPDSVRGTEDDPRGSPGVRACTQLPDGGVSYLEDSVFGRDVQVTKRRSMSSIDAMFFPELFWDGRAGESFMDPADAAVPVLAKGAALETQAVLPILNSTEMACNGRTWADVLAKLGRVRPLALSPKLSADVAELLQTTADYPALFAAAFGDPEITPARIAMAIASYERTQVSSQTPWDRWQAGDDHALSPVQLRGLEAYMRAGCHCCHAPPLFASAVFFNDGFSLSTWDRGRAEVTHSDAHTAAFRTPGLRNVGLREAAGLLHDGVGAGRDLNTLVHRYTQPPLFGGGGGICRLLPMNLNEAEIAELVEFLRSGLTDPRVSAETAPFDHPTLSHP